MTEFITTVIGMAAGFVVGIVLTERLFNDPLKGRVRMLGARLDVMEGRLSRLERSQDQK